MESEKARSKLRINLEILRDIAEDSRAKPTRIPQKANLSYERMTKYLKDLVENNLVGERWTSNGNNKYYFLTNRGIEFLDEMKEKERSVSIFGLPF